MADSAPASVTGFQLPTTDGGIVGVTARDKAQLTVVCFLGSGCPLARLYAPRLTALAEEFEPQGVRFIGINSNQQDSMEDVRLYAADHGLGFPVAKDYNQMLADRFGAERTPHVFVLDTELRIRYRGRIDDQYLPGISRSAPAREDLRLAMEELLSGKEVTLQATVPNGCIISREKRPEVENDVTFCKQVSRILQRHCVECHRPGEIGPFSLTDYDEVVGWSDMILEVIEDGRMPPWHASPEHGEFANARHMPTEDQQALKEWVAAGAPYGDPADLADPPEFVDGWLLPREPDLVLPMRNEPFAVPASGTVEYQYFVVDPGFKEDRWVTAAQVVPGNRSVVHHSIVFIRPPDGTDFRGIGWLAAYVPGQRAYEYPSGTARRIPAGSKLVFQMHYTPTGKEEEDVTQVGIVFGEPKEVTHEAMTLIAIDQEFEIPPHEASHEVRADVARLPAEGKLLAIVPHMHYRGKSFRAFAQQGKNRKPLLHVPRYDFNWQHIYQLATPMNLAEIDGLPCKFTFDNSPQNPFNPGPSEYVTWGDQSWEEMAVAFFDVSVPLAEDGTPRTTGRDTSENLAASPAEVEAFVERFMKRFDSNGNGNVERAETPRGLRRFGFSELDGNGDDRLSRDELHQLAQRRLER